VVFPAVEPAGRSEAQDRGYTQGHAAGYAAGLRAAAAEQVRVTAQLQAEHNAAMASGREAAHHAVALLTAAAAAFQQRFNLVLQDAEAVLAASALDLAEAVLSYELDDGERTARAALQRALSGGAAGAGEGAGDRVRGGTPEVAAVRLHPADIAVLAASGITQEIGVELVPDSSLARGDAMAQYPEGWLDARLSTALARARTALLGPAQPGAAHPGPAQPYQPGELS
jgi:flagellar assembly protein FliH